MPLLNAYQIAEAFPDEVKELVPKFLTVMKAMEWEVYEKERMIMDMSCSAAEKALYILFARSQFDKEISNRIQIFEKALYLVNNNYSADLAFGKSVHKARTVMIESLYQFQRSHRTELRIKASCPFHGADKHPSLVIYRDNNTFHCFTCKVSGDSIDFYMKINKTRFMDAVKALSK